MPCLIGITGTIGSGKSAVGKILTSLGVPVIDTDRIVHELLSLPNPVRTAVVERFGSEIIRQDAGAAIDREKLGKLVFRDHFAKRELEAIVHPAVLEECKRRIDQYLTEPVVALLVPLLFEAGIESEYDQIWTVVASEETLHQRLRLRDNLNDCELASRLAAQLPQEEKASRADHIIDNSGSLDATRQQVEILLAKITTKK